MEEAAEWEGFVDNFSESLGREKSEEIVEKAVKKAQVGKKNSYSKEEAVKILDEVSNIDESTSYLKIAANSMKTNLRTTGSL